MTARGRWTLESVAVRGVLAFPVESTFRFAAGSQVVQAPNHSGKTSLTMALLWALTGQVPSLPRIDKKSFRLFNRKAGDKEGSAVIVTLRDGTRQMIIRREYQVRAKEGEGLEVEVGDSTLAGGEAQRRVQAELGVSVGCMEGCGVVLQDFRLKLITDTDSAVGAVVNEMLGLGTLSDVVPVLRERAADADRAAKEVQAFLAVGDPLARWEEETGRLAGQLQKRESEALAVGFNAVDLEQPEARAQAELSEVRASLRLAPIDAKANAEREVEQLRKELALQRKSSPDTIALAAVQGRITATQALHREIASLATAWEEHHAALTAEAEAGPIDLDDVAANQTQLDQAIAQSAERRDALNEEHGFLTAAYDHLQAHAGVDRCPVCGGRVSLAKLRSEVGVRLSARITTELDKLNADDDQAKRERRRLDTRLKRLKELHATHESLISRARDPGYTGLEMNADISRESVRYRLMAVSSLSSTYADAAGHVLSGGDLSAASVALLVGLASGDAHRLGFLVLDDPAEQMDHYLQDRLARQLAVALPERQVIVLTHQPEFAEALVRHGMARTELGAPFASAE